VKREPEIAVPPVGEEEPRIISWREVPLSEKISTALQVFRNSPDQATKTALVDALSTAPTTSSARSIAGELVPESIDVIQSDPDLIALVSEEYTHMLIATRGVEPSAPVVRVVLVELPAARMDPGFEPLVEKPTYNVLMLTATRMPALEILPGIPESVPIEAPNTLIEPLPDPE
jgi:hypothetical protein